MLPNAGAHLLPDAGARHEWALGAVGCSGVYGGVGTAALLPPSRRARFDDTHGRGRAHRAHNAFEVETRCGKQTSKLALGALAPRCHRKHLEIEQERALGLAVLRALG